MRILRYVIVDVFTDRKLAGNALAVFTDARGFGQQIRIEQGAEANRPSVLFARALGSAEHLERIEVGGSAVLAARGELVL